MKPNLEAALLQLRAPDTMCRLNLAALTLNL